MLRVLKRNGKFQRVDYNKVTSRIKNLCDGLDTRVNYLLVAKDTISSIADGISTSKLDVISAKIAENRKLAHPDNGILAARLLISNLHKTTPKSFSETFAVQQTQSHYKNEAASSFISKHAAALDAMIVHARDYSFDYFGYRTLEDSFLRKVNGAIMDRPQYIYMRVAVSIFMNAFETPEECLGYIRKYYDALSLHYFTNATPTLQHATDTNQMDSCFLLGPNDDIRSIMKVATDCSIISKEGGGIGLYYTNIRPCNSTINSSGGKSSGITKQLKIFNEVARAWDQGGKRKGAIAVYIEPWHADIQEFVELRRETGEERLRARDLFYGLWIPDLFMMRAKSDGVISLFGKEESDQLVDVYDTVDQTRFTELYEKLEREGKAVKTVKAKDIINAINETRRETGTPYICYKDHVNRMSNQKNVGTIRNSNLCVVPETYVLTDKGQHRIVDLVGKPVNVWNGEGFSAVIPTKTGDNQKIISVNFSNGVNVDCTEYHKFYVYRGSKIVKVEAKDLLPGDKLIKYSLPTIYDGEDFKYAYTHGMFCSDGTYENAGLNESPCGYKAIGASGYCGRHQNFRSGTEVQSEMCQATSNIAHPKITLYGEKRQLDRYLAKRLPSNVEENRINVRLPVDIAPKFTVPVNAKLQDRLDWFAGYCDGDGCVVKSGGTYSIQCSSIDKEFLLNVRLMLQTMGIDSKVSVMHKAAIRMLPDGKGGMKEYPCKTSYRLLVTSNGVAKLQELGFDTNRLIFPYQEVKNDTSRYIAVESVVDNGRMSSTYCFTEKHRGMGMFNGVLTGNCAEIMEWSSAESYACCTLGSMNLKKFLRPVQTDNSGKPLKYEYDFALLHEYTELMALALDIIIDITKYPVPECEKNSMELRPIAIGVQGLADVFATMRVPFLSEEAEAIDIGIAETIYHAALTMSVKRAKTHGSYKYFEGSPASQGKLHQDMWEENQQHLMKLGVGKNLKLPVPIYDWDLMRAEVKKGLRNSLLSGWMPTVTTSQVVGNNESFEPFNNNAYSKSTKAGKFIVTNKYMIEHLIELGLWNPKVAFALITGKGSLSGIPEIPEDVKEIYKTVWELSQMSLMRRAAMRQAYIDQSQSLNIHLNDNSDATLTKIMYFGWCLGLKTGSYYTRTKSATDPIKLSFNDIEGIFQGTDKLPDFRNSTDSMSASDSEDGPVCYPGCDSCSA